MIVKTEEPLNYYDGTRVEVNGEPLTIAGLVRGVLNSPIEEAWTPETLLRCGTLAKRASSAPEVEMDDEERAFIKARAAVVYKTTENGPLYYSLLVEALSDPPATNGSAPEHEPDIE